MRIDYLDGLRGVAILLVVLFHAYSRWVDIVPYGDQFSEFPIFRYGYLGVQLFFLISGFVILMTLEKCKGARTFLFRRWLRLFPAMLVCSIFIYLTAGIFSERPNGNPEFKDLLAGMSFVDPYVWNKIFGVELKSIEGAFWSLYVEFKFYVVAAFLYYYFGRAWLVFVLFLCYLSWFFANFIYGNDPFEMIYLLRQINLVLDFKYYGWFAAGAAYYIYVRNEKKVWFFAGILMSFLSAASEISDSVVPAIAALVLATLFASALISNRVQYFLSGRFLLYFGFISYPLYLLHENLMIAIVVKLGYFLPFALAGLSPLLAISFVCLLSYFVAKIVEPRVRSQIEVIGRSVSSVVAKNGVAQK